MLAGVAGSNPAVGVDICVSCVFHSKDKRHNRHIKVVQMRDREQRKNPGGGRDFPPPSTLALGPTQPPIRWVPTIKRPGRGVALTIHSYLAPRLKKE